MLFEDKLIFLIISFIKYPINNPNKVENLPENFILEFVGNDFSKIEKKEDIDLNSHLIKKYVKVRNSFELI